MECWLLHFQSSFLLTHAQGAADKGQRGGEPAFLTTSSMCSRVSNNEGEGDSLASVMTAAIYPAVSAHQAHFSKPIYFSKQAYQVNLHLPTSQRRWGLPKLLWSQCACATHPKIHISEPWAPRVTTFGHRSLEGG